MLEFNKLNLIPNFLLRLEDLILLDKRYATSIISSGALDFFINVKSKLVHQLLVEQNRFILSFFFQFSAFTIDYRIYAFGRL